MICYDMIWSQEAAKECIAKQRKRKGGICVVGVSKWVSELSMYVGYVCGSSSSKEEAERELYTMLSIWRSLLRWRWWWCCCKGGKLWRASWADSFFFFFFFLLPLLLVLVGWVFGTLRSKQGWNVPGFNGVFFSCSSSRESSLSSRLGMDRCGEEGEEKE